MESEDGSVEFETPTDDEEVTIPSQDKYKKVQDIPISDIRNEKTGYYLRSPCMGLAHDKPVGSALR